MAPIKLLQGYTETSQGAFFLLQHINILLRTNRPSIYGAQMDYTPVFQRTDHPWRRRPAEYIEPFFDDNLGVWIRGGWYAEGHRIPKVKPYKHFIWPTDGKRRSKFGRFKDILQGKGPDIHLTFSAHKHDYMHNRPRKPHWSNHINLDDRGPDSTLSCKGTKHVNKYGHDSSKVYDFKTRKFRRPYNDMWTDARWQEDADAHRYPISLRNRRGGWIEQNPYALAELLNELEE